MNKFISHKLFSNVIEQVVDEFVSFNRKIELDGKVTHDGKYLQDIKFVGPDVFCRILHVAGW